MIRFNYCVVPGCGWSIPQEIAFCPKHAPLLPEGYEILFNRRGASSAVKLRGIRVVQAEVSRIYAERLAAIAASPSERWRAVMSATGTSVQQSRRERWGEK
jgi:hypothetical protein